MALQQIRVRRDRPAALVLRALLEMRRILVQLATQETRVTRARQETRVCREISVLLAIRGRLETRDRPARR